MSGRRERSASPRRSLDAASIGELEALLGVGFRDPGLLVTALTHPSFARESAEPVEDYQRLEFLGDATVGFAMAIELSERLAGADEGELSRVRSGVVSRPSLAQVSRALGLGDWIRFGAGELLSGGPSKEAILADVCEAVIGARVVDAGAVEGVAFARRLLSGRVEAALEGEARGRDAKTELQELTQSRWRERPRYELVLTEGPAHALWFEVACHVRGELVARGRGRTRRAAEQEAAAATLASLRASA